MQNPKTGTTWAPDIRPEKIETFEETYTPEGGEQQTAIYNAVDNHPILNKVLDKFAFFKTHVSAIWYNKLANITLKQKLDEMDAGIQDVSAKIGVKQNELLTLNSSLIAKTFNAYKVGRVVNFYMYLETTVDIESKTGVFSAGTFKEPYKPLNGFIVCPLRRDGDPFNEIGTMWIERGRCLVYGSIKSGSHFYIQGSFVY